MVREHLAVVQPQRGTQVERLSRLRIHGALVVREAVKSHVIRALAVPAPDAAAPGTDRRRFGRAIAIASLWLAASLRAACRPSDIFIVKLASSPHKICIGSY